MNEERAFRAGLRELAYQHSLKDHSEWPRPKGGVNPESGTVAIVGKGPTHVLVPYGAANYEFWGLNDQPVSPAFAPIESYDRWFQLHPPRYLAKHYPSGIDDLAEFWGEKRGLKLYMDRHYPEYPDSMPYPLEEVGALPYRSYHVSSFDWMVALAVLERWSCIELYGCEFYTFPVTLNGEPVSARPCLEYWLGVAEGRGTEVNVYQTGDLFANIHVAVYKSGLHYGFEREPALDLSLEDEGWSDVR